MNRNLRIGIFSAVGILLIIGFSVYVNDHPFWYRPCNEVKIHVDDATGLRRKSPVKTLGLDIGYINEVTLDGDRVMVSVCVTGRVKLNNETRAYIRSAGFLGDKFLELKPVARLDGSPNETFAPEKPPQSQDALQNSSSAPIRAKDNSDREPNSENDDVLDGRGPASMPTAEIVGRAAEKILNFLVPPAQAARNEEPPTLNASREAELQDTMKKVGKLIDQLALMVGDLREVTQQKEFKETVINLNQAMKNLEGMLRPNGKLMRNMDDAATSLRNTMSDAEAVMKKVKEGEGSVGKFINDPSIYDELRGAIQSINLLLGRAGALKTYVDLSAWSTPAYGGGKARLFVIVAPNPSRYYLLGVSNDPRGRDRKFVTTTQIDGGTPSVMVRNENEERGIKITALFGKYFGHLDVRAGLIEDNGAVAAGWWFDEARRYGVHAEVFYPGKDLPIAVRAYGRAQVWSGLYVTAGIDQQRKFYNPDTRKTAVPYFFGAGLFFDDDDLKYLLAFSR